ncbi:TPA: SagB/ThcOx family dehydrogenase [Candidatus Poribacteria bacterium]|nr:SagB/ThcOx family dehydrogenase [Candidatus Poribacteria bacterium]
MLWASSLLYTSGCKENLLQARPNKGDAITLPKPSHSSAVSVEETLQKRRSIRRYKDEQLTLAEVSQLLWAAQGITASWGGRTAPSAGALYPMEIYLVAGKVEGLEAGVYRYNPKEHVITKQREGDARQKVSDAALGQEVIRDAPISLILAAVYERTTRKYGQRGIRYVHIEVGHVGQNIYLQAETLGLGTVMVGAFYDQKVKDILGLDNEEPLGIMPVGRR